MDKESAKKLLDETFNNDFDINQFYRFINELFNNFAINQKSWIVWSEYQEYIESYFSLGNYTDNSKKIIDVIVVKLKKTSSRDRARTMQRNFIAKFLANGDKDAALVAFYGEDPQDWRFSFVKMEYSLTKDESGKVKVLKELTPAKRYSFLVGVNEPNHTCKKQFLELVMRENINPSIEEIEKTFSIDNVTKEFFEKYRELYLSLKESFEKIIEKDKYIKKHFEDKNILTVDFAKKLMGQIVFIYFLQKKGWLGVGKDAEGRFKEWGTGHKDFLRKLFEKKIVPYNNFFNEILEPLFYEALATERDNNYYSRFKCKIPFLNGGLFEPINDYDWSGTEILIGNPIFENILKTFDQYNFTVKEDEPLEKEVAIDPEMLGKVFENLLEVKARKSNGAFYTPREIVHYMCQQSLINYLETNTCIPRKDIEVFIGMSGFANAEDERNLEKIKKLNDEIKSARSRPFEIIEKEFKETLDKLTLPNSVFKQKDKIDGLLKNIKIVDPAVGSGAFLVGMMNEIVKAQSILTIFFDKGEQEKRTEYNLKRDVIENCLYGVDIDYSAVEIAKLRFWLSLIVDEEDIKQIKPLPNLDHKVMCGNSLLEEFEGVKLFDEELLETTAEASFELDYIKNEEDKLNKELHDIHTGKKQDNGCRSKEINQRLKEIKRKKQEIKSRHREEITQLTLDQALQKRRSESRIKLSELKKLQKLYFNEQNRTQKREYAEDIDRIEWKLIEETLKEQGNNEAMQKLQQYKKNKSKPFFLWKLNFAEVFQRENPGFDVVIANPPYIGERKHKDIFFEVQKGNLKEYYLGRMDYFYFFFHLALNLARNNAQIAMIITNYFITALGAKKLRSDLYQRSIIRELINLNELKIFESASGQHNMITLLTKSKNKSILGITSVVNRTGLATSNILNAILSKQDEETEHYNIPQLELFEGDEKYIRVSGSVNFDNPIQKIFSKMALNKNAVPLGNMCNTLIGLESSMDKVYVISIDKINEIIQSKNELNYVKPFYKNSDINKYYFKKSTDQYILYLHEKIKDNIADLKGIYEYLSKFKKGISSRKGANLRGAFKRGNWWVLNTPRVDMDFEAEKIVTPYRAKTNKFAYCDIPWYASRDVYFITKKMQDVNLKYITGLLNSKLYFCWLYYKGKRKGDLLELYSTPLSEIPIKKISPEQQTPFINLVNQILPITQDDDYLDNPDKQAKVKRLEKEIDQLVYNLYELTPEEIKIVEEFNNEN